MDIIQKSVERLIKEGLLILGDNVEIQENVVLGIPEEGDPDNPKPIIIGDNTIIRAGAIIYQGVHIGSNVRIGHNNVLRSYSEVGDYTVLSHNVVIEHHASLGRWVRISPHTHITSHTVIEDSVFIGAGVVTINEKYLIWNRRDAKPHLVPPHFKRGCKVGSGSTVMSGVTIGELSIVGAGSVIVKDIPPYKIAYGNPARPMKDLPEKLRVPNGFLL
ncbi:hypothetical protein MX569_01845 [Anoxybacillus kestanbolensis]|uniref:acyltransferase n=1 Tax=Anoxybacillus kestanbolensis TaxID=227476 RepID=UPI0005420651|nr:N-acetyltransferase [Anoxybacillus kestanbolensis]KHF27549.1 dTDP-3-amino-3,6-dideoxy-alpha-D-galactopyranose 3-N-acetyltransferase [Anoxybacillus sp. BCO1]MCL9969329.1 hypothetical protein [Anoxybacillus kestanbolensis]